MTSPDSNAGLPLAGTIPRRSGVERAEIAVLEALAVQGEAVLAQLDGGAPIFRSRLRFVDPDQQYIVVEPSTDAAANAALLALARAVFLAEVGEWRIEFAAADPEQTVLGGTAAIRLRFPEVISSRRRRAFERARVPPEPPLRCVASAEGVTYFEASIVDISRGGIGILQAGPNIALQAGMMLKSCRIECPDREPVILDLEVRHAGPAALADGRPAQRAGCRFLNLSPASAELIVSIGKFLGNKS